MKRAWIWIALVLSLGVNIGVLATIGISRWRPHPAWERNEEGIMPQIGRLADRLELAGDRRARFLDIQRRFVEETQGHRKRLQVLRFELRQEVGSETPDQERIDSLLAELLLTYSALDRTLVDSILGSQEVLDPEQRRRYLHLLGRMREEAVHRFRGGGRGEHRPVGRGPG